MPVHAVVDMNGYYRVPDAATDDDVIALVDRHAADLATQQADLATQRAELDRLRADAEALSTGLDGAFGCITELEDLRPTVSRDLDAATVLDTPPREIVGGKGCVSQLRLPVRRRIGLGLGRRSRGEQVGPLLVARDQLARRPVLLALGGGDRRQTTEAKIFDASMTATFIPIADPAERSGAGQDVRR